jgi:hypothetical protein
MNKKDDIAAAESMSSPFEKQLCDHKHTPSISNWGEKKETSRFI